MTATVDDSVADALRAVDELLLARFAAMQAQLGRLVDAGAETDLERLALPQLLAEFVFTGGKRLRPTLCHWGWIAAGGAGRAGAAAVVQAGAAIELLHAFALIHDDVMDGSVLRRGRPSLHRQVQTIHERAAGRGQSHRFGVNMALLVGDLAHAAGDELAAGLPAAMREVWTSMVFDLVAGQHLDLIGEAGGPARLSRVSRTAALKSGSYTVTGPLRLGATAAGASAAVHASLAAYGALVGEAFAFRDDVLGVWGDPQVTGKPASDDLRTGKQTVVLALARQRADLIGPLLGRVGAIDLTAAELAALRTRMQDAGVRDDIEARIRGNVDAAVAEVQGGPLTSASRTALTRMAECIAWRDR
jgi:geranylgeranyl diphosphate synthase type I